MPSTLPDDLRRWIDHQPDTERGALARTWDLSALATEPIAAADTDEAWTQLNALLDAPPVSDDTMQTGLQAWQERGRADAALASPTNVPTPALTRRPVLWSGLAAAVVVLIAATMAWMRPVTVTADANVLALALPDGSDVTLAPGSELVYRRGLRGDMRRIELAGQAMFDVAHDERPFAVETFNASVEVLGTRFDVQAWPKAQRAETAVALLEGSVRLRSSAGTVVLQPGDVSRVTDGAPTLPSPIDTEAVTAWRNGAFSVVDAPLGTVVAALEARFGPAVRLAPGVDATRRLTLYLPSADSADVVLRDLAAYLDLRVQVVADRYDLIPR